MFWEQSARLVEGERIWEAFRARGGKVGMIFWQQSMGEAADLVVTLRPRQDRWIIEELRWLDRPPGMLSGREQPRRR